MFFNVFTVRGVVYRSGTQYISRLLYNCCISIHYTCSNYSGSTPVRYSWVWQAFNFQRGHSFNIQCTAVLNSTRVVTFYVHAAFL